MARSGLLKAALNAFFTSSEVKPILQISSTVLLYSSPITRAFGKFGLLAFTKNKLLKNENYK